MQPLFLESVNALNTMHDMFETIAPKEAIELQGAESHQLLDIRSRAEKQSAPLPESIEIPYSELPDRLEELPSNKKLLIVSQDGTAAASARNYVQAVTFRTDVYALDGGLKALNNEVTSLQKVG